MIHTQDIIDAAVRRYDRESAWGDSGPCEDWCPRCDGEGTIDDLDHWVYGHDGWSEITRRVKCPACKRRSS